MASKPVLIDAEITPAVGSRSSAVLANGGSWRPLRSSSGSRPTARRAPRSISQTCSRGRLPARTAAWEGLRRAMPRRRERPGSRPHPGGLCGPARRLACPPGAAVPTEGKDLWRGSHASPTATRGVRQMLTLHCIAHWRRDVWGTVWAWSWAWGSCRRRPCAMGCAAGHTRHVPPSGAPAPET
jgi:hypothetical protein